MISLSTPLINLLNLPPLQATYNLLQVHPQAQNLSKNNAFGSQLSPSAGKNFSHPRSCCEIIANYLTIITHTGDDSRWHMNEKYRQKLLKFTPNLQSHSSNRCLFLEREKTSGTNKRTNKTIQPTLHPYLREVQSEGGLLTSTVDSETPSHRCLGHSSCRDLMMITLT